MAMAGYSSIPLIQKMGIKVGMKLRLIDPPDNYFSLFEADISKQVVKSGVSDIVHLFVTTKKGLYKHFNTLIKELSPEAIIWISWYKKSAKIPTDVTEDIIREIVLPAGWVDVKVCAVSELWSGLKIVKRISER
jgi:hypothetical protein